MDETDIRLTEFDDETVTVIIPFSEEFTPREMLEEAIETVEEQVGVDAEPLVIEDEEQRGPAWARNRGLERAETRLVAFLDADDLWHERKLLRQLRRMEETGAGMCVEGPPGITTTEFIEGVLTNEIFALTSAIVVDTDRVDTRFCESLPRREDHLYMIEVAADVGVCRVEDLFEARKYEEGMSTRVDKTPEQAEAFFELVVERVPEAERFREAYYHEVHIEIGRWRHKDEEYWRALQQFRRSLEYGVSVKAIGAVGLTVLAMAYRVPLRTGRRLVTQ